jgi:hypothetical protein
LGTAAEEHRQVDQHAQARSFGHAADQHLQQTQAVLGAPKASIAERRVSITIRSSARRSPR